MVDGIIAIPSTKIQLILFITHCGIRFTQYTAVYQDKETGYGVHQAPCIMEAVSFLKVAAGDWPWPFNNIQHLF